MNTLPRVTSAILASALLRFTITIASTLSEPRVWNFDKDKTQVLPQGWFSEHTGQGTKGNWQVVANSTAPSKPNVLAQTSEDSTSYRFPLAIVQNTNYKDLDLSVRFKAISGKVDQGAGVVWRFRDANNYYIVRANALENNVVLYKVENGKRISLAPKGTPAKTYGVKTQVPGNAWNKLSVQVKGNLFTVSLNDQKLFEVEDGIFTAAGKVGLWTKADSVIHFDDFTVEGN